MRLAALTLVAVLSVLASTAAGCGGVTPSQPVKWTHQAKCEPTGAGGMGSQIKPAKLPGDFPIYPGAQVLTKPYSFGTAAVNANWTTSDKLSKPADWYKEKLQGGDFMLYGEQHSDPCIVYYRFERRSNQKVGGLVTVATLQFQPGVTYISASIGPKS